MPPKKQLTDGEFAALMRFGACVRRRRKQLGLSAQQLANKISGVDKRRINLIEAGKHNVSFATAMRICEALESSIRDIWGSKGIPVSFPDKEHRAIGELQELLLTEDVDAVARAEWAIRAALKEAVPKKRDKAGGDPKG